MSNSASAGMQRNTLILIAGSVVQTVIALLTVPAYLAVIGEELFGVYVIAALVIGYFGILDRGLNAAVQNEVAQVAPRDTTACSKIVWTAAALNAVLGLVGGAALIVVGWILFEYVLSLPDGMRAQSVAALPVLAACVPVLTISGVFQGGLVGRERFVTVSLLDTVRITALQVLPLAFAYWWGAELIWLAAGFFVALALSGMCYFGACLRLVLRPTLWARPSREMAVRFFHYGKWVTVTSVISPLLDISDRIVIGAVRGATAVTTFAIPYNLASRLLIVPFSLIRVAFPRFSAISAEDSRALGTSALAGLAASTAPLAVLGATFAAPFLAWWIGPDLAASSAPIAAILFAGMWVNGLGYVPYGLLQAQGRPDLPARVHAFELIPFLVALAIGVRVGGPFGAAVVWSFRALFDSALLLSIARLPWHRNVKLHLTAGTVTLAAANGVVFADETPALVLVGLMLTTVSIGLAWVLSPAAFRSRLWSVIRRRSPAEEQLGSPTSAPDRSLG